MPSPAPDVDAYIAAQPAASQPILAAVRAALREALPEATESITYAIPTYKLGGKPAFYFAGWKAHWALYPVTPGLLAAFAEALAAYTVEKGTIRFPLAPPPVALIGRLAAFRAQEMRGPAAER